MSERTLRKPNEHVQRSDAAFDKYRKEYRASDPTDAFAFYAGYDAGYESAHRWTRVVSSDEIPDGHWWLAWKGDSVGYYYVQRKNLTEKGFREQYADVIAYAPYIIPEYAEDSK